MTTLIICAKRDFSARFLECSSLDDGVRFVRHFEGPKTQEFHGRVKALANALREQLREGRYDHLILCAEHPGLVQLRGILDEQSRNRIIGTVELDLSEANETDLVGYIAPFIIEAHKRGKTTEHAA